MSEQTHSVEDLRRMAEEAFGKRNQTPEGRAEWKACERRLQQMQLSEVTVNAILRDLAARVRREIASAPEEQRLDAEYHMRDIGIVPSSASICSIVAAAVALNFGFRDIVSHVNGVPVREGVHESD